MGVLSFWFWSLYFWELSFFVFVLDAIFCGTNFFIFQDTVWLVKSSWCVHCCLIHQVSWFSDRCRSEFALWWFFVRKSGVTVLAVFSFWSWLPDIPLVFINLKDSAAFLGLKMHFFLVIGTWECFLFNFSFFLWNHVIWCVYQWCGFSRYKFSIFDQSVWLILSFWCAHFYSFIQFFWVSGRCTSEFTLECFCLKEVITNW